MHKIIALLYGPNLRAMYQILQLLHLVALPCDSESGLCIKESHVQWLIGLGIDSEVTLGLLTSDPEASIL